MWFKINLDCLTQVAIRNFFFGKMMSNGAILFEPIIGYEAWTYVFIWMNVELSKNKRNSHFLHQISRFQSFDNKDVDTLLWKTEFSLYVKVYVIWYVCASSFFFNFRHLINLRAQLQNAFRHSHRSMCAFSYSTFIPVRFALLVVWKYDAKQFPNKQIIQTIK